MSWFKNSGFLVQPCRNNQHKFKNNLNPRKTQVENIDTYLVQAQERGKEGGSLRNAAIILSFGSAGAARFLNFIQHYIIPYYILNSFPFCFLKKCRDVREKGVSLDLRMQD
jgi:hypothetical protein